MNYRLAPWPLAAFLVGACARPEFPTPPSPPPVVTHVPSKQLRVGAARADITPPPGVSLFGHGPEGRVSDGYWSRLYCRAFVFVPDNASPLAVVTCDLGAIGMLLQRSVAEQVADIHLLPTRIMLTATHTHAGPAHYFEGDFYGGFMSSRDPGFDPKVVAFLATRIGVALHEALRDAAPARLAWGRTAVWGLTRNRSLVPFQQNDPPYVPDPLCQGPPPATPLLSDETAIDPCLDVLRIDAVDAGGAPLGPIGSLSFFAMHPTVLPNTNRLLGADVDGVVSRLVEKDMRAQWLATAPGDAARHDPVAAVVNTNEGDVSPSWHDGTPEEAVAIGEKLANRIRSAAMAADPVPSIIDARYVEAHLPGSSLFGGRRSLCAKAELGLAVPKGASDHRTALTLIGDFRDENVDFSAGDPCSTPRREVLGPVQNLFSGPGSFPEDVGLAVAQLGDTIISFVPAEMTTTAGSRLARAVAAEAAAYHLGARRSLVAGLANGYLQYVTTEEEYALQHYEGASDLYGKWTSLWLNERYALLARAMAGVDVSQWLGPVDTIHRTKYTSAARRSRLPTASDGPPIDAIEGRGARGFCRLREEPVAVCFWWKDGAPGVVFPTGAPWVHLVEDDVVRTPVSDPTDPFAPVDDRGLWFRTEVHSPEGAGYGWSTALVVASADWATWLRSRRARIRVGTGASAVESPSFSSSDEPPACNAQQVIFCGLGQ